MRVYIVVMNPLDPNSISLKMNIPDMFSQETVIKRSEVKKTKATFILRKTNHSPSYQCRFVPGDCASPQEVAAKTNNLLDNSIRNREDVQPELNYTI
jgi:hypothetical protein